MTTPVWLELAIAVDEGTGGLRVSVPAGSDRVSAGEVAVEGLTLADLQGFAGEVAATVERHAPLSSELVEWAEGLHARVFNDKVRTLLDRARGKAANGAVLLRLRCGDPRLRAIPWEAMKEPSATGGVLAHHGKLRLVRAVESSLSSLPREVSGAVSVLLVSTEDFRADVQALATALEPLVAQGEIRLPPPVVGFDDGWRRLTQALARERPHVVHFIGHGRVADGVPQLMLDAAGDGARWTNVSLIAGVLAEDAGDDLRLVYLQSCEGAAQGDMGSAAETIAAVGVEAVVAHLWPVEVGVASAVATSFYEKLTTSKAPGDLAAALNAARRFVEGQYDSAEYLSPVLFLRGEDPILFEFDPQRGKAAPVADRPRVAEAPAVDPKLVGILEDVRAAFARGATVLVGAGVDPSREVVGDKRLRAMLKEELHSEGGGLDALMQRLEIAITRDKAHELANSALNGASGVAATPPGVIPGLARLGSRGLWITLLWLPIVERALAEAHPDVDVYVIQPLGAPGGSGMMVLRRPRGGTEWTRERGAESLDRALPLDDALVVLRPYGGFPVRGDAPPGEPVFTEDDHLAGLERIQRLKPWLLDRIQWHPMVVAGLDPLHWTHRNLLRGLLGGTAMARGSLATISVADADLESKFWESPSGPGGGANAIKVVALSELEQAVAPSR